MKEEKTSNWLFLEASSCRDSKVRLIFFPFAGGVRSTYSNWAKALPRENQLIMIECYHFFIKHNESCLLNKLSASLIQHHKDLVEW
ncbi:MAG: hypothetical protein GY928_10155 [Colwellia sp.]|nr:hypothetical protein [Colwellia sp.]